VVHKIKQEIAEVKQDKAELKEVLHDVKHDIKHVKSEIKDHVEHEKQELKQELKHAITKPKVTLPTSTSIKVQPMSPMSPAVAGTTSVHIPGHDKMFLSDCSGTKKALLIGINYVGSKRPLKGCWNDVKNIRGFIKEHYGFLEENMVVLTDEQTDSAFWPTKANILANATWLVKDAQPGDSLFFHYSGHGGQTADHDGDEDDGMDESIMSSDYLTKGQITDDDLHKLMVDPLPAGVRLTCCFDSCHSGTVLDLPYLYRCDGEIEVFTDKKNKEAAHALLAAGKQYQAGDTKAAFELLKTGVKELKRDRPVNAYKQKLIEAKTSHADVIQFAGSMDSQTSADAKINGVATGAMSLALIKILSANPHPTYTEMLQSLQTNMKKKYSQVPQMSTGRPIDMSQTFII
jgi:hypothetical protein